MIKENVRKEICLLLILTIIASLTFSQTVYAAMTESVTNSEHISMETVLNDPNIPSEQQDNEYSENDIMDRLPADHISQDSSATDQNQTPSDVPVILQQAPMLKTEHLHLLAGGDPYELHVANAANVSYEFSAEYPSIAALSNATADSVTITPISSGSTVLSVTATGMDGTQSILSCQITISELSIAVDSVNIYMNDKDPNLDIALQGIDLDTVYYETGNEWEDLCIRDALLSDDRCSIHVGNPKVADAWFSEGFIHIKGISKGITNVKLFVYGISLSIRVQVHHYTLNKYVINTYKGSAIKSLKVKGSEGHKVTWVSGNKNVASVSRTGIVTINGIGTTKITAKVNGRKVICIVSVSSKTAYRVIKDARAITKKKNIQYSQALRMSKNYYDCSSLIYRCYRPYGIRFGYTHPTWAPTAADEGRWCKNSGHIIAESAVEILNCKLVPGDTIYYSFNGNNGRYLNIDHTAFFSGYAYDPSIGYYGTVIEASSSSNTVTERMYYASDSIQLIGRPSKK